MKRSVYLLITGVLSLFVFTGCNDLFNSSNFKQQLEQEIERANAPSTSLTINYEHGVVSTDCTDKASVKEKESYSLEFSETEGLYQFAGWICSPLNSISFESATSQATTFTVNNVESPIVITPVIYRHLSVTEKFPSNAQTKVPKNTSITITFSENLSANNDLSLIEVLYEGQNLVSSADSEAKDFIQKAFNAPVIKDNKIVISANRDALIEMTKATGFITVKIPASLHYTSETGIDVNLGKDYSFEYQISNETNEKLSLKLNATPDAGTISLESTNTSFSINDSVNVTYKPNDTYLFDSFKFSHKGEELEKVETDNTKEYYLCLNDVKLLKVTEPSEAEALILKNSGIYQLTLTVLESLDINDYLDISADAYKKLQVTGRTPETKDTGVYKNSSITIDFSETLSAENDLSGIQVLVNGINVLSSKDKDVPGFVQKPFEYPELNGKKITIAASTKELLEVTSKTAAVTVTVPKDLYYTTSNGINVSLENDYSFSYVVSRETIEKTDITVSIPQDSGTAELSSAATTFSLNESLSIEFTVDSGYRFDSWNFTSMQATLTKETIEDNDKEYYIKNGTTRILKVKEASGVEGVLLAYNGIQKITVTVLNEGPKITVRPETTLIPVVKDTNYGYLTSGINWDAKIKFEFNKDMTDDFQLGTNVLVKNSEGTDVSSCYRYALYDSEEKTLTLVPDCSNPIVDTYKGATLADFIFELSSDITDSAGCKMGSDYKLKLRFNTNHELIEPEVSGVKMAVSRTSLEAGDDNKLLLTSSPTGLPEWEYNDYPKNHIKDKVCLYFKVKDTGSGLKKITLKEYSCITCGIVNETVIENYETKADVIYADEKYVDYTLLSDDGLVNLIIEAEDLLGNKKILSDLHVVKDTVANVNINIFNYEPVPTSSNTGEYTDEDLSNEVYYPIIVVKTAKDTWITEDNSEYYTYAKEMTWKFGYTQNENSVDNCQLTEFDFEESYIEKVLTLDDIDTTKDTYIKIFVQDAVGNSKTEYFTYPGTPELVTYNIEEVINNYYTDSTGQTTTEDVTDYINGYKSLDVLLTKKEGKFKDYSTLYVKYDSGSSVDGSVSYFQQPYRSNNVPFGIISYREPEYTAEQIEAYNSATKKLYIQVVYEYEDDNGDTYSINGPLKPVLIQESPVTATPLTITDSNVTISANDSDTQKITVTLDEEEAAQFDSIVLNFDSDYYYFEGNELIADLPTEIFFFGNERVAEVALNFYGIKNGKAFETEYKILNTVPIEDNIKPFLQTKTLETYDYTSKFIELDIGDGVTYDIREIGYGLETGAPVTITYDGTSVITTKLLAGGYERVKRLKIPVSQLTPGKHNIKVRFSDKSGNVAELKLPEYERKVSSSELWAKNHYFVGLNNRFVFYYDGSFEGDTATTYQARTRISFDSISGTEWVVPSLARDLSMSYYNIEYKQTHLLFIGRGSAYQDYVVKPAVENSFVRIYVKDERWDDTAGPMIYYTGHSDSRTEVSVKDINVLTNGVQIYNDEPVFVHTLFSDYNWGDNVKLWEQNSNDTVEVSPLVIYDEHTSSPYYYGPNRSEIQGKYYMIIVYFADGTYLSSGVKTK